jgi:hypothetical protein
MRLYTILVMILLYLFLTPELTAQVLEKKVTLQTGKTTIGATLKKIKQAYGIKFSYADNIVPVNREVNINFQNTPLREILDKLFTGTSITYQLVGDQVVLKRDRLKGKSHTILKPVLPDTSSALKNEQVKSETKEELYVSNEKLIVHDTAEVITMEYTSMKSEDPKTQRELRRIYRLERKKLRKMYAYKRDSLNNSDPASTSATYKKFKETIEVLKEEVKQLRDSLHKLPMKFKSSLNNDSASVPKKENIEDSVSYRKSAYQITIIPPLGTNGAEAINTVNKVSINVIGGCAAGLDGIEFGSIANIEKDYVHGLQFSGFVNIAGKEVHGGQFAGFLNLAGKDVKGPQFAGFANINGDSMTGAQGAGFCNVNNGSLKGFQAAGFCNVNKGAVTGMQGAGFCNVNSDSLKGAQFAGFANINSKNVKGLQVGGFINVANKVNGMQIGFINIADSVQGIPLGFLSIVRRGYRRVEFYGSESMYANIAFKTGVRKFYNIFYLGGQMENNYYRWAFGYGLGTELKIARRIAVNLDLLSMQINENEGFTDQLNLLNQLKVNLGFGLSERTYLFFGPSLNVMVSQYVNFNDQSLGSKIGKGTLYNYTDNSGTPTNIKAWIGLNGGIRF